MLMTREVGSGVGVGRGEGCSDGGSRGTVVVAACS